MEESEHSFLEAAVQFLAIQEGVGHEIREKSKDAYGDLLESHATLVGIISSALLRRNGDRTGIDGNSHNQLVLIGSFIQGLNLVESSISEGYYLQAASLLRQELETIAALEEEKKGVRNQRRTPNVSHVPWGLSALYGDLSKAAHAADHSILENTIAKRGQGYPEDTACVIMTQCFNEFMSWNLFGLHIALLVLLASHLHEYQIRVHGEGFSQNEINALKFAHGVLIDVGWLKKDEP